MMNVRSLALLILGIHLVVFAMPSALAADGWLGASSSTDAVSPSNSKKSDMSSWLPWSSSKPKVAQGKRHTREGDWARSTKKAWSKTVSFLNPFDNAPAPKPLPSFDSRSGDWHSPSQGGNKVTSVPDWLGGERPKF